jgi:hypothetical protein
MHHGEVLKVGVLSDPDPLGVAADDRVVPDAGARAEMNVSQHHGARSKEDVGVNLRWQGE